MHKLVIKPMQEEIKEEQESELLNGLDDESIQKENFVLHKKKFEGVDELDFQISNSIV